MLASWTQTNTINQLFKNSQETKSSRLCCYRPVHVNLWCIRVTQKRKNAKTIGFIHVWLRSTSYFLDLLPWKDAIAYSHIHSSTQAGNARKIIFWCGARTYSRFTNRVNIKLTDRINERIEVGWSGRVTRMKRWNTQFDDFAELLSFPLFRGILIYLPLLPPLIGYSVCCS